MHIWTYHLQSDHGPSIMQNLWKERQRKQGRFHLQSISPAFPLIITLAIIYLFIYFLMKDTSAFSISAGSVVPNNK